MANLNSAARPPVHTKQESLLHPAEHLIVQEQSVFFKKKRVAWSSVFAGAVITLMTFTVLGVLGTAVGAGSISPLHQANPFNGLGMGAAVWTALSALVAVSAGGAMAGRYAPDDSGTHGLLSWALVTLLAGYMISMLAGSAIGVAGSVVSAGAQAAGNGIAAAEPGIASGVKNQLQQAGISPDWNGMKGQLESLMQQTGKPELQPSAISASAKNAKYDADNTASDAAATPQNSDSDLAGWIDRVKQNAQPMLAAADTDALANIIAARTGKSHEQAKAIAENYAQSYKIAMAKYQQMKQQADLKAREMGDEAAAAVTKTAAAMLGMMILGALLSFLSAKWAYKKALAVTPIQQTVVR